MSTLEQKKVILNIPAKLLPLQQATPYKIAYGGRGSAKAIDVNEVIPTPSGYVRLADIKVGCVVFDETGNTCKVTEIHESFPEVAYRVHFSDGATIDCCSEHEWVTWTHAERKCLLRSPYDDHDQFPNDWPNWTRVNSPVNMGPQTRTTQEIADTLTHSTRGDANHCIPLTLPLRLPEAELPIDPYVLGYWLANGTQRDGYLTIGSHNGNEDYTYIMKRYEAAGYPLRLLHCGVYDNVELRQWLRNIHMNTNKYIPDIYLRASILQRTELLHGLMDGDGTADGGRGTVSFSNKNENLARGVFELVTSLGHRPTIATRKAMLYEKYCGDYFQVAWRPLLPPFSLPRKAAQVPPLGNQALRSRHRMIHAVERIPSKPMRCLTVASPNHMYLVTRHMIPTHNSWSVARLLLVKTLHEKHIVLCAREFQASIADSVYRLLVSQIDALNLQSYFDVTQREIRCLTSGSIFIFKGIRRNIDEIKSTEGVTVCWVEEAQSVTHESWQVLTPTVFRNAGSEMWVTFNPRDERDATYQRFVLNPPPGAIVIKANYNDNPWFSKELDNDRLWCLRTDTEAYDWIWNGNVRKLSDAIIFRNKFSVENFIPPEKTQFYYGVDWGFADDPTVMVQVYMHDDCLFINKEAYGHRVEIDALPDLFDRHIPEGRGGPIKADSSRPETISYMANRGFAIKAADKWPGCIEDGIMHLKAFKSIIVHERCIHAATEFALYSYKEDKAGNVLPEVVDKHNHCIAEGQLVTTKRGKIPIESVVVGDEVVTRNGWRRVYGSHKTSNSEALLEVCSINNSLLVTSSHEIFTCNRGFVSVGNLTIDDVLLVENGNHLLDTALLVQSPVVCIKDTGKRAAVFDLSVEHDPEFVVSGILVHNCIDAIRYSLDGFIQSRGGIGMWERLGR